MSAGAGPSPSTGATRMVGPRRWGAHRAPPRGPTIDPGDRRIPTGSVRQNADGFPYVLPQYPAVFSRYVGSDQSASSPSSGEPLIWSLVRST